MAISITSYNMRLGLMVRKILSDTGISDLRVGSVISAILQAAAQSDFEIETSIVEMIKLFNIDTTEGSDLDSRAAEFNIVRYTALPASDVVRIGDSSFTKKSSKIYIGLPAPVIGDMAINIEDASAFPVSGSVYVGRGTGNYEGPIVYTSLTNNVSFWTINLSSSITKNHVNSETVVLAQGGNRIISVGTTVQSQANNYSPAVGFYVTRNTTLVDGEVYVDSVPVTAKVSGTIGNVPAGSVQKFTSLPFSGATVTNLTSFSSGQDVETDSALRTRMRNAIQLIARGTKVSILQAVSGVSDPTDNKRVVSATLTEPISLEVPAQLYIDDGSGFEPSFTGQGVETIVKEASGSEQRVQISNFPIAPPILVASIAEPYGVQPGDTLTIYVDKSQETITFLTADFSVPGVVKASELIDAINSKASLAVARATNNGESIYLVGNRFSDGTDPEEMSVAGTANSSIMFPSTPSRVLSLYKDGVLLKKNASSGVVYSLTSSAWSFGSASKAARMQLQVDDTPIQDVVFRDTDFYSLGATYKTATSAQWATIFASKIIGISSSAASGIASIASNKSNSSSSVISLFTSNGTSLTGRASTAATWRTGYIVRYDVVYTEGVVAGDYVNITGFINSSNNVGFTVVNVGYNEFIDVISTRTNGTDDESSVVAGSIDPKKDDLVSVMFGGAVSSTGTDSSYTLNRFSGEIELTSKMSVGSNLTAGSQYTSAYIDSIAAPNNLYNFLIQGGVSPALYVSIDSNCAQRIFLIANGDTLTQTRFDADHVDVSSNRTDAFSDTSVGDYVYIATKTGGGYPSWFITNATGVFQVTGINSLQSIRVKNPDPAVTGSTAGVVSNTIDVQVFSTDGLIQKIPLYGNNLTPTNVAGQVNTYVQYGEAIVFNSKYVRLMSNSLTKSVSKVFVLATAGTANNLYTAGTLGSSNQPHIGFQLAGSESTTFPRLIDGVDGFFGYSIAQSVVSGDVTSSSISVPYENIDSAQMFLSETKIDDEIVYTSGNNLKKILSFRSIDSDTQITPQTYNSLNPIYDGDKYLISESHKFTSYDTLIVELDQDSTNKTFLIPMYRTGRIKGTTTTTQFDAYDADSAPGTDFNNSIWQGFSFQDFGLMFRARNVYKANVADSSFIIRSAIYGEVGENIKFSVQYPGTANQGILVSHSVHSNETDVNLFLGSGAPKVGISNVGTGFNVSRSGQSLIINYSGIGASPNFSGNGVILGDIVNVSESAFSSKSPFFGGTGKVTSVSATQLIVKLPNSTTISTTYSTTAAQDSGSGTTITYPMANTGLLALGDVVQVSGFTRTINNGNFYVVGVNTNISITVSSSNRSLITASTTGYRVTSGTTQIQFSASLTGQVSVLDYVVISGMVDSNLNGTFQVTALLTTTLSNDTIQFMSAASDTPAAITLSNAIWQVGTTVRYASTNTTGVSIGNYVVITGFVNGLNNGTFLVSNVLVNSYIEVVSTRTDGTLNETHAGIARPTYFATATHGTVYVINNETHSAVVSLVLIQAVAQGIAAYPLGINTVASMISAINSNTLVKQVVTAVLALGYTGTGVVTKSTADETVSVGYGHIVGISYVSLYDGKNYVLDFTSATVNLYKNFTIKKQLTFSHPDYDPSTAPNIAGELTGEYFKLSPTTNRNVEAWFNKSNITSFSILGSAAMTANNGSLQLSSQTIGTAGAVQIIGGGANGIESFLKIPASVDSNSTRCVVNNSDNVMLAVDQIVEVSNSITSRKPNNVGGGSAISVDNINGTTGKFKINGRILTLSTTNNIAITDVTGTYGRSALGIVWRWTAGLIPSSPFTGVVVGDAFQCSNTNMTGNMTPASIGDGYSSFFPVVGVDSLGQWIDVVNPNGAPLSATLLGAPLGITISPSLFTEWKHKLSVADVMSVESIGIRNQFKYTWISGTTNPLFAQCGVSIDDYVMISGGTFLPENRGTFRIIAITDTHFVIENTLGISQSASVVLATDVKFFYSESVISGDNLNISDLTFKPSNRGVFSVINYGTDAALHAQYVTASINNSTTQVGVSLTGLPNTFFVTDGNLFSCYRRVVNFAVDPSSNESAIVYLYPATNYHKMSNSFNTHITPIQKFSFGNDVAIGTDGYRYYTGLLAKVQKVVDGYDPDPTNYPGYKAAGTQIEVVPPLNYHTLVDVVVATNGGININSISDSVKLAILNYINGLGVGQDIIISEITSAVMSVEGVASATLVIPDPTQAKIVIQDNQKAVIKINQITVSSG